eukprot:SAG31_NODE_25141_length_467_cov_0.845109_1_plen_46_part_10
MVGAETICRRRQIHLRKFIRSARFESLADNHLIKHSYVFVARVYIQ